MLIPSALAISALAWVCPSGGTPPGPVTIQVQYDPAKLPGHPLYNETLANLIYPVGKGPVSMGYPPQALPVYAFFRGGNSNSILPGVHEFSTPPVTAKDYGFVGVSMNYAIIGPDEDMSVAVASLDLLMQYLRHHHVELNISPDRIVAAGRSAGTLVGYGVALKEDKQDLGSPEPQHHWSSRPNYYIPRYGPSSATCFAGGIGPWESVMSLYLFADKTFGESTPAERLQQSPTWWLLNPQAFGRTTTPPMCVVSFGAHQDVCGSVTDPHSGLFGDLTLQAIDDFAEMTGRADYRERSSWVDSSVYADTTPITIAWALSRLADDFDGLHIMPPEGVVGPSGGTVTLRAVGGTPGSTVSFYSDAQLQPAPLAACPGKQSSLAASALIGTAVANENGLATLDVLVPSDSVGSTVLLQAIDLVTCELSGVEVHTYY